MSATKSTMMSTENGSVTELLQAIDKNISSASLDVLDEDSTNNMSGSINISDEIKPLKLKNTNYSMDDILHTNDSNTVMENIPRAPSFDELEFNTRLNREPSLSRLSGPRQLANSSLSRTFSNKMGRSSSFKSSAPTTRDNSPSKKSVCFEDSPPKIVEYDELTPDNSDNSTEDHPDATFESNWDGKLKPMHHPLPPPPPKHQILTPSPQKDTTLGSSDEDTQDFNLTKEDLQNSSITLEQRLDLVLGSDEVSKRVQQDEINRGSGSPLRSVSQKEEELLLSIKNKERIAEEDMLRDASELFEQDLRNSDKSAFVIRLDPVLKRKNSNNSLRDEERELSTTVVSQTQNPITLVDGMKNADPNNLPAPAPVDDLTSIAESTADSFASATDIIESEPAGTQIKKEPNSSNSISTLQEDEQEDKTSTSTNTETPKKGHKKKLSLSESISSFMSSFGKSKKGDDVQVKLEKLEPEAIPGSFVIEGETPAPELTENIPDPIVKEELGLLPSPHIERALSASPSSPSPPAIENVTPITEPSETIASEEPSSEAHDSDGALSIQSSIHGDLSQQRAVSPLEHASLLNNSSPHLAEQPVGTGIDDLLLSRPPILADGEDDADSSFADEFKETMLYNSSDRMNESYRSVPGDTSGNILEQINDEDEDVYVLSGEAEPDVASAAAIEEDTPAPKSSEVSKSPLLHSSLDTGTIEKLTEEPRQIYTPTDHVDVEVAVQTEDLDFGEDFGTLKESLDSTEDDTREGPRGTLPSFNSTLFHDKVPEDDMPAIVSPPTSYIDIWHSQPKPQSPQPQYGSGAFGSMRTATPPENILRRLSTRRSKSDRADKITLDASQLKDEASSERKRLSLLNEDSFIATSVSQSSVVKLESRNTSMNTDSSLFPADTSNVLTNSSGIGLPDLSSSSDFALAFKEWDVSQSEPTFQKSDNSGQDELVKAIWGSNEPATGSGSTDGRTPPFDAGKIENMIAKNVTGEEAHVKSSSAVGQVIVSNQEDHGVDVEYESHQNISFKSLDSQTTPYSMLTKPSENRQHPYSSTIRSIASTSSPDMVNARLASGISGRGLDLNSDFEKAFKMRIGSSSSNDILDKEELSTPIVPEVDNLSYMKTRVKNNQSAPQVKSAPSQKSQAPRVRTPLAALAGSELNQASPRETSVGGERSVSQPNSVNYQVGDQMLKTQNSRMSMFEQDLDMTSSDKGRLYIRINKLEGVLLDNIKNHKATFKLYLDNGKHTIATPMMDLDHSVAVDKEFEIIIDDDITEVFFTFKVTYHRPENELVEVYEKIPLKNNRLSRLIGAKPKFRVQKAFETRKVVNDPWDSKFANDGSFGKNKISFFTNDNEITGKSQNYIIELFNEWETVVQNGKKFEKPPHLIGKMDVTMMYIPRTSPLETLPPSMKIANSIADHLVEQSNVRHEGFLFQEGGDCDLWKRRFFRLEGTKLIAHHEVTKKPRALINLLKTVDVMHNGKKRETGGRNFTDEILMNDGFKLKFKNGEIITFNAETEGLKAEWINALEKVVGFNKFHQPWVKIIAKNKQ